MRYLPELRLAGLLILFQGLAWVVWGREHPSMALMVATLPGAMVCGATLYSFVVFKRGFAGLPPLLLALGHIHLTYSPRQRPRSSLFDAAINEFLEQDTGPWESYWADGLFLLFQLGVMVAAALVTAEVHQRMRTGRWGGGRAFARQTLHLFDRWDKEVTGSKDAPKD